MDFLQQNQIEKQSVTIFGLELDSWLTTKKPQVRQRSEVWSGSLACKSSGTLVSPSSQLFIKPVATLNTIFATQYTICHIDMRSFLYALMLPSWGVRQFNLGGAVKTGFKIYIIVRCSFIDLCYIPCLLSFPSYAWNNLTPTFSRCLCVFVNALDFVTPFFEVIYHPNVIEVP